MSCGSAALKTWVARVTRSWLTIAFFLAILANYAAQSTLHGMVLSYYTRNRHLVTNTIDAAGVQRGFTVFRQGVLEICSGIPTVHDTACYTVYNGSAITMPQSIQCAEGLTWLENYLINSKSEQILYLVLESWLVVTSLIALIHESIPHLIVVLAAQLMNTGWISYRVSSDISAKHIYEKVVVNGTCGGFDILDGSWQYNMFYATLGCSIAALFGLSLLVFELIKLYSKAKLSSVGSPPVMNQMLRWRLWMRVFLQFATFFTLSSAAIWYDKVKGDSMPSYYSMNILYDVGFYVVIIITLPWLTLGAHTISKENRPLFLVYAILSVALLIISGLWYASALYRYEYWAWRTFACVTTAADALLVITCILSVICRLNFGKGLAHFLVVEHNLQASGFTCDTFLNDPSELNRPGVGDEQLLSPAAPLSQSALYRSRSPFRMSKRPPSSCSVETAVFATWLSHADNGNPGKCNDKIVSEQELGSTVIIPKEDMRSCSVRSISDEGCSSLDEFNGKEMIVS